MEEPTPPKVFISYSHDSEEHKNWVLQLATRLRHNGVDVILDQFNLKLGRDLPSFMEQGLSESKRVIAICSDEYVKKANSLKGGAGYEKYILTAELMNNIDTDWIIPLIRNNTGEKKMPTFLGGRYYISFEDPSLYEAKYEELLRDLHDEPIVPVPLLGENPFDTIRVFAIQKFLPSSEKYLSPAPRGTVTFDYSNNNGRYTVGLETLLFETKWSSASGTSMYIYNDPPSIRSVARADDVRDIRQIKDARAYDTSSRTRTIDLNEIAVCQNENGFYAAFKVLAIKCRSHGDARDEVTFEYVIQTNGSPDFT